MDYIYPLARSIPEANNFCQHSSEYTKKGPVVRHQIEWGIESESILVLSDTGILHIFIYYLTIIHYSTLDKKKKQHKFVQWETIFWDRHDTARLQSVQDKISR